MSGQINNIAQMWWGWMWPMFWQVAVVVALVWVIDLLIRRRVWPQVRYALWLLVLLKLVLPPGLACRTSVTSQLEPLARDVVKHQLFAEETHSVVSAEVSGPATELLPQPVGAEPAVDNERPAAVEPIAADTIHAESEKLCWQAYAMLGWLLGVLILTAWLIVRFRQLWKRHAEKGDAAELPEWFGAVLADTAKKLKLKRLPKVVLSRRVVSPAVFGAFRPVLLMPAAETKTLSRERIEHVLLHELAHVKRGDLKVHAFYMVLQIIYWFNPLLWLVRRHLQHLRELCCDATVARVLREKTLGYRETILETARRFLARPAGPGMGLLGLFEDSSRLQVRLKWLEKRTWKYRWLRIAVVLAIVAFMLACVLPMAATGENKEPTTEDSSSAESGFSATLANGVTVELVGVSEHPSEGKQWWRPDGELLAEAPAKDLDVGGFTRRQGEAAYELVAKLTGPDTVLRRSKTPERWRVSQVRTVGLGKSGIARDQAGERCLRATTAIVNKELEKMDVEFGLAGIWEKKLSISSSERSEQRIKDLGINVDPPYDKNGNAVVTIRVPNATDGKMVVKVIAVLKNGDIKDTAARSRAGKVSFMPSKDAYEFYGLSLSDVDSFEILTSDYQWVRFNNVSLRRGVKTNVEVRRVPGPADVPKELVDEEIRREQIRDRLAALEAHRVRVQRDMQAAEQSLEEVRNRWGLTDLEERAYPHAITSRLSRLELERDRCILEINGMRTNIENLEKKDESPDKKLALAEARDNLILLHNKLEELDKMRAEAAAKKKDLDLARVQYQQRLAVRDERREMLDAIKQQIEQLKIMHDDPGLSYERPKEGERIRREVRLSRKEILAKLQNIENRRQRIEGDMHVAEDSIQQVRDRWGFSDLEERSYPHPVTQRLTRIERQRDDCVLEIAQLQAKTHNLERQADTPEGKANLKNARNDLVVLTEKLEALDRMQEEAAAKKRDLDMARVQYKQRAAIRDERKRVLDSIKSEIEKLKILYDDPETPDD